MKKFFNIVKHLVLGLWPAIGGGLVAFDLYCAFKNIVPISNTTGWLVVMHFLLALAEIVLAIMLLYTLGRNQADANSWSKYKKAQAADNISGSSCDCETSDEAADTSSN